jgi:hypothetical protein
VQKRYSVIGASRADQTGTMPGCVTVGKAGLQSCGGVGHSRG